jgi:hypothetical protein
MSIAPTEITKLSKETGFLPNLLASTNYFRKKPGFWVPYVNPNPFFLSPLGVDFVGVDAVSTAESKSPSFCSIISIPVAPSGDVDC